MSGDVAETVHSTARKRFRSLPEGRRLGDDDRKPCGTRGGEDGTKTAEFYAGGWVYPVTLDGRAAWVGGLRASRSS